MQPSRMDRVLGSEVVLPDRTAVARRLKQLVVLVVALAVAGGYGAALWHAARVTAEVTLGLVTLLAVRAAVVATRAANRSAVELDAEIEVRTARIRDSLEEARAEAREAARVLAEREAALAELADELQTKAAEARTRAEYEVGRLEVTGQLIAAAQSWAAAAKSKKPAAKAGAVELDQSYWWERVAGLIKARWPAHEWHPDELLSVAEAAAADLDPAGWRRLASAEYP